MNIKETILNKISTKEITMRPRILFAAQAAALVALAAGVVSTTVFLVTYTLYFIRTLSDPELLQFGGTGIAAYLFHFPWHLVIVDALCIALLAFVLRHIRGGHRVPLAYALGGLALGALFIGVAVDYARVHDRLYEHRARLPFGSRMLYDDRARGKGVCRCVVTSVGTSTLTLLDERSQEVLVAHIPLDNPRATTTGIQVGQRLFVAGVESNGTIDVFGIRPDAPKGKRGR